MLPETLAIFLGLSSALLFGTSDFIGGVASKEQNSFTILLISYIAGLPLLFALGIIRDTPLPAWGSLLSGGLAGVFGMFGLGIFYRTLAVNRMGVVAPVTALMSAALPVIFGAFLEGVPSLFQITGFILGFMAIWFLSAPGTVAGISMQALIAPILAGICFGLYFITMDHAVNQSIIWPMVASRISGLTLLLLGLLTTRKVSIPIIRKTPLPLLAGFLDTTGCLFFALAVTHGRLDIASVLTSMYPAATVLLAWIILKEKLRKPQLFGLGAALAALALIAI